MSDEENGNLDPTPQEGEDTQDPESTPPAGDDGHGEEGQQPSPEQDPQGQQPSQAGQEDLAAKREEGKLRQVQEELKAKEEALRRYEESHKRLEVIENSAMRSPETYKQALMVINGMDEATADQAVQQEKANGRWQQEPSPQQQPQGQQYQQGYQPQQVDPYQAAYQVVQSQAQAERTLQAFLKRVPELSPDNVPKEKQATMSLLIDAVDREAQRRMSEDNSLDYIDTLEASYKDIRGLSDEQLQSAREEGKIEGMVQGNMAKASQSASSRGTSPKESSHGLTPEERQAADAEGLSYEEFAMLKDPVTVVG